MRAAAGDPAALLAPEAPRVLAIGQSVPMPPARRGGTVSLPIDVTRTVERLLDDASARHRPRARAVRASAAAAALRHSHALNVGTFHSPTERVLSTQVARRFIELFFGRLDARMATFDVTRDLIQRFFPGDYELVSPGVDLEPSRRGTGTGTRSRSPSCSTRSARRCGSSCARCAAFRSAREWTATVWSPRRGGPPRAAGGRAA